MSATTDRVREMLAGNTPPEDGVLMERVEKLKQAFEYGLTRQLLPRL